MSVHIPISVMEFATFTAGCTVIHQFREYYKIITSVLILVLCVTIFMIFVLLAPENPTVLPIDDEFAWTTPPFD